MDTKANPAGAPPGDDFEPTLEWERGDATDTLLVFLPGFKKEQLKVQITSTGNLRIIGERQVGANKWNRFRKELPISSNYDTNKISAKFDNGILYVKHSKIIVPAVPHVEPKLAAKPRQPPQPTAKVAEPPKPPQPTAKVAEPPKPPQPPPKVAEPPKPPQPTAKVAEPPKPPQPTAKVAEPPKLPLPPAKVAETTKPTLPATKAQPQQNGQKEGTKEEPKPAVETAKPPQPAAKVVEPAKPPLPATKAQPQKDGQKEGPKEELKADNARPAKLTPQEFEKGDKVKSEPEKASQQKQSEALAEMKAREKGKKPVDSETAGKKIEKPGPQYISSIDGTPQTDIYKEKFGDFVMKLKKPRNLMISAAAVLLVVVVGLYVKNTIRSFGRMETSPLEDQEL